ncbi:hypothetical protein W97_09263 [Coniosporium apollinis CBS 100218]|uniref:CID domain-containing protein n=1 Tax=Coniosporium apollinis (strain CBS 100218) TaxID=1168221 RepID=R7Z763_CONA1|nr:uncharacterized protein W97_09263 [Coniosporium apollinis CBS 100218]EON69997.1 hypothetical protein W97_09263 [Coniosporium apollinis CBS 100218]
MSDKKIKEFPDLSKKLAAPTKKSLFERQKAEAEAKRQREEAETAAAYQDFAKSFDIDNDTPSSSRPGSRPDDFGGPGPGKGSFGGAGKRHFGVPTGPRGSSGPGSLGPPPSLSRKRAFDGSHPQQRDREQGRLAFGDAPGPLDAATAFQISDDEDEKAAGSKAAERAAPKPTLHLSSLPPGTSQAVIKSLIPPTLTVDGVRSLPPSGPGSTERRSMSAIVTLAKETPASDIDTAVNALQNRYLGLGHYLSISRHLSSAALGATGAGVGGLGSASTSQPFNAKSVYAGPGASLSRAPPPGQRGGFAPPSSYNNTGPDQFGRGMGSIQVSVNPPSDLKQLKLIHKALEALITHGPEFEALLMSRPEVQRDEKWAWLWDSRSAGGIWYRWRLWEISTGSDIQRLRNRLSKGPQRVFDSGAPWLGPERSLPFEFTTRFDDFVSDPEYDSSGNDESGDEAHQRRLYASGAPPDSGAEPQEKAYLNPLQKAKLTHLLARLPTTTAKLRKGDVARVTAFAIRHAGAGADEIVDMIVSNVERPFAWSAANPDRKRGTEDDAEASHSGVGATEEDKKAEKEKEKDDPSSSKLIALYLISDIFSSSATSGVRGAWRYRQLFEAALKSRRVFEHLGRLEKDVGWGRMRAEKFKRSVTSLLGLWEGWSAFPQAAQEHFVSAFNNPPLTEKERAALEKEEKAAAEAKAASAAKSRWKTVDVGAKAGEAVAVGGKDKEEKAEKDVSDEPMQEEGIESDPMEEDLDGKPTEEIAGEPMDEDTDDVPLAETDTTQEPHALSAAAVQVAVPGETMAATARRQRPKAVDMFADSDEE